MNTNTRQLLERVGYTYPEYAELAQRLVQILAQECASMATANSEPLTAQAITARFLSPDVAVANPEPITE